MTFIDGSIRCDKSVGADSTEEGNGWVSCEVGIIGLYVGSGAGAGGGNDGGGGGGVGVCVNGDSTGAMGGLKLVG